MSTMLFLQDYITHIQTYDTTTVVTNNTAIAQLAQACYSR